MFCLHRKTTPKRWRLATRHSPCPCCHRQCCGNFCADGAPRVTSLEGYLLCCSCCSSRWGAARRGKCVLLQQNDKQVINRIFQGVKAYTTNRRDATGARCSGKKTCTPKGVRTGRLWLLAEGGLPRGAGPRQQRGRTSSLSQRIQVGHAIRALPRESNEWQRAGGESRSQTHQLRRFAACLELQFVLLQKDCSGSPTVLTFFCLFTSTPLTWWCETISV